MKHFPLLFLLLSFSLSSQSAFEIMSSGEYRWGRGSGSTAEEAASNAKMGLINNIVTYVIGEVSLVKTEVNEENSSTYGGLFSSYTKTYSKLRLKNLSILPLEVEDGIHSSLAYIRESDFRESVDEVKTEIREIVRLAEQSEQREGMASAYLDYYRAYLHTFYSPEPVSYVSISGTDSVSSVKALIENKLRSFFSNLRLTSGVPFATPNLEEQIEIPLSVSFSGKPVSKLSVRIDNPDSPQRVLRNGKTNLIIYSQPSRKKQPMGILLSPSFEENSELKELHAQFAFQEKTSVTVDFSSLITLDFTFREESRLVFAFSSVIKNLSIAKIEWNFGDGNSSSDMNPKHLYKNPGSYEVTLTLNGDPDLRRSKTVVIKREEPEKPAPPPPPPPDEQISDPPPNTSGKQATADALSEQLLRAGRFQEVKNILDSYKDRGLVIYGNKNAFVNPDNCFVLVIDPVTAEVKAVLAPGTGERADLLTGTTVKDISASYKGMKTIWAEVLR